MFRIEKELAEYYNPVTKKRDVVEIEIRFDPLTGKRSRVIEKPLPISTEPDVGNVEKEWCPFCDENIYNVGARDTRIANGELIERGEAILLANITPYAEISLVIRLTKKHYLPISEFEAEHFYNAFILAKEYLERVGAKYANIMMNYLKPAGSSVTHPHIQVIASKYLLDYQERVVEAAKEFYEKNGANFWDVMWERSEERKVAETKWRWFTPFAPRGFEHVCAYINKGLGEMDEELLDLSEGIVKILKAYSDMGYNSFNFGIFGSLEGEDFLATQFDIVARSVMSKYYWNDVFAITKIYDEAYTNKKPEDLAKEIKKYF